MTTLPLTSIRQDGGTQPRAILNGNWIEEYAHDMLAGAVFPPVIVFHDGTDYWLADGFHRVGAAEAAGATEIEADVRQGTVRDAILFSVSANAAHGQRRTNEDKRRAVHRLLDDPEWVGWSDSEIARRCGVSHTLVQGLRPHPIMHSMHDNPEPQTRTVQRGGTTYEQRVRSSPAVSPAPDPSLVESKPPLRFDWEAAEIRAKAWNAINALAELPNPQVIIDAWMKFHGYGEPVERIERAIAWLQAFLPLFREAEPRRWAVVEDMLARSWKGRNVAT